MSTDMTASGITGRGNGDPYVEPLGFTADAGGATVVDVRQIVRDLDGKTLSDKTVGHIFRIERGLIRRFDIRS